MKLSADGIYTGFVALIVAIVSLIATGAQVFLGGWRKRMHSARGQIEQLLREATEQELRARSIVSVFETSALEATVPVVTPLQHPMWDSILGSQEPPPWFDSVRQQLNEGYTGFRLALQFAAAHSSETGLLEAARFLRIAVPHIREARRMLTWRLELLTTRSKAATVTLCLSWAICILVLATTLGMPLLLAYAQAQLHLQQHPIR